MAVVGTENPSGELPGVCSDVGVRLPFEESVGQTSVRDRLPQHA